MFLNSTWINTVQAEPPWRMIYRPFLLLAFKSVFLILRFSNIILKIMIITVLGYLLEASLGLLSISMMILGGRKGRETQNRYWERENHFFSSAVELPFPFLYSHLHSSLRKTTGASSRWILSQLQTDTSATAYLSLNLKDVQQQPDLCRGVSGQRTSLNREGGDRLGHCHLSTLSRLVFNFISQV